MATLGPIRVVAVVSFDVENAADAADATVAAEAVCDRLAGASRLDDSNALVTMVDLTIGAASA